jgi:hypothetical protein
MRKIEVLLKRTSQGLSFLETHISSALILRIDSASFKRPSEEWPVIHEVTDEGAKFWAPVCPTQAQAS